MAADDWYRNPTWTAEIETHFEQKLRRARDKQQYLRIQSSYLVKSHPAVAVALLDRYFAMGEHIDMASAYVARAEALAELGDVHGAAAAYVDALDRESRYTFVQTMASIDFPCFVLKAEITSLYAAAMDVLDDRERSPPLFPIDRYRAHGARALLLQHFDRIEEARAQAMLAMEAAGAQSTGLRYHPHVGLVRDIDDLFGQKVAVLAKDQPIDQVTKK